VYRVCGENESHYTPGISKLVHNIYNSSLERLTNVLPTPLWLLSCTE